MQADHPNRTCAVCGIPSEYVAGALGVCGACIRDHPDKALPLAMNAHHLSRKAFGLPETPPQDPEGIPCGLCVNACRIAPGDRGYYSLRRISDGTFEHVSTDRSKFSWYLDPLLRP